MEGEEDLMEVGAALKRRPRPRLHEFTASTIAIDTPLKPDDANVFLGEEEPINNNTNNNKEAEEDAVAAELQEGGPERCVFFDRDDKGGIWKCHHCIWTYQMESPVVDHIQNSKGHQYELMAFKTLTQQEQCFGLDFKGIKSTDRIAGVKFIIDDCSISQKKLENEESDLTVKKSDIQKSPSSVIHHQHYEDLKDKSQYDFPLQPSEKSCTSGSSSFKPVDTGIEEHADVGLVKGKKQEVTELDVERVIEEQDTHDLYCPNCNSCITKRVILRKRKRKIRNINYDAKREKIEVQPVLDRNATNVEDHDNVESGLDGIPPPATNDRDHHSGPDIFRCLSCFSFFIPTASGFKLFWLFGDRGVGENMQSPQQIPARNFNWFSSIFESIKGSKTGDDTMQHVEVDAQVLNHAQNLAKTLPDQKTAHVSSNQGVSSSSFKESVNDASMGLQEDWNNFVDSSTPGSPLVEKVITSVEEKQNGATKKINTGDNILGHAEDAVKYPSGNSDDDVHHLENDNSATLLPGKTLVKIGEPGEDVGLTQQVWPKFQVSSIMGSVLVEKSQFGVEQKPDGVVKMNSAASADEKNGNSIVPTKSLTLEESHVNEKVKVSAGELCKDDQNVIITSPQGAMLLEETQFDIEEKQEGATKKTDKVITGAQVDDPEGKPLKNEKDVIVSQTDGVFLLQERPIDIRRDLEGIAGKSSAGDDEILLVELEEGLVEPQTSQGAQNITILAAPGILVHSKSEISVGEKGVDDAGRVHEWDILKSIVYGGLIESITSLGVVSSAAGSDATTLNVVALGLANLIGGLFVIAHSIRELKNDNHGGATSQEEQVDRYQELLGQRENFPLHATVAVLSYIIFGLLPPVTYGFSFRKSDNKEYKLIIVGIASLLCIILLAIGKEHVWKPRKSYVRTVLYYVGIGFMASGLSYAVGVLIKKLLEKLGWFESSAATLVTPSTVFPEPRWMKPALASY